MEQYSYAGGFFTFVGNDNSGYPVWEEWQNNRKVFSFIETERDNDNIYLWDGSSGREIWVLIPKKGGKFGVAKPGANEWAWYREVKREETIKFLHLSDLHICADASANIVVEARMKYIEDHYPQHNIIITGDIIDNEGVVKPGTPLPVEYLHNPTNLKYNILKVPPPPVGRVEPHLRVAERAFQNAYNMLKRFKGRIFICPGNHDYGVVGNFYHREFANAFDKYLSVPLGQHINPLGGRNPDFAGQGSTHVWHTVKAGNIWVHLFALDSNLETDNPFDLARGQIGSVQLKVLESVLSTPRPNPFINEYRILFLHHHPWDRDIATELLDSSELLKVIERYPVDFLLFGHKHVELKPFPHLGVKYAVLVAGSSRASHFAYEITIPTSGTPIKRPII